MKTCAIVFLLVALAAPAVFAIDHNEAGDGDLNTNPATPTALAFTIGSNTVTGTTGAVGGVVDRDYITFTIAAGHSLTAINLLSFSPDNLAFVSLNTGTTSFVPSGATAASFLAGAHPNAADIGVDLLELMVSESVTGNSLPAPQLGPGDYCFLIQQTNPITQTYSLDFVIQAPVSTTEQTWGAIKALYR
jgi:hypothetical protein